MEIKKTSLNKLHQVNQAKFVEFAGYEMPIQYSSGIIEEHNLLDQILEFLMCHTWGSYLSMVTII